MKGKKEYGDYSKSVVLRICKFIHIIMLAVAHAGCLYYYNETYNRRGVGETRFMLFVILYCLILCFALRTFKSFEYGLTATSRLVYSQTLSIIISGGAFYIVFVIANSTVFTPVPLVVLLAEQLLINVIWSVLVQKAYFKFNKPKRTALIYREESEILRLREVYSRPLNYTITQRIKTTEGFESFVHKLDECEAVFVADISSDIRNEVMQYCINRHIRFYVAPQIGDIMMRGARHMDMFSVPVFCVSGAEPKIEYAFIKRAVDIICSLLGIILLSPIMAVTAIAIRAYDKGPAFYKQIRLTRGGKKFEIYKFRSMRVNAESDGVARLASDNDDRITPVGKIIRACRLDELPQLINILKGDMTIVGPRPERPEIAAQYEEFLPEFKLRLQVKAGLTGLAQVYGRYNTEPYDKLQMDLMYINEMSLVTDLRLVLATIKILFIKDSTQGAAEGRTKAMTENKEKSKNAEREVALK